MIQDIQNVQAPDAGQSTQVPGTKPDGSSEKGPKPRISEDTLTLLRIIICIALILPIFQLYMTIPSAINMWVAGPFVPFVNIIYFVLVIAGGIWLIRYTFRFSDEERKRLQ